MGFTEDLTSGNHDLPIRPITPESHIGTFQLDPEQELGLVYRITSSEGGKRPNERLAAS